MNSTAQRALEGHFFVGLTMAIFALAVIRLAVWLPPSPETPMSQETFAGAFGWSQRLYIASLTAYVLGQLIDISVFATLRRITGDKRLWLRATGSTLIGQALDTVVVTFVLLYGAKPVGFIWRVCLNGYVVKLLIAVSLTPMIYAIHSVVSRRLSHGETPRA